MIHQYIKELVENNNRIIIPDFGAFMVQDSSEGKQVSFNDFLKFNDGLLVNQIIKSEKVSKAQATEQVKTFIKEIESCFGRKEAFELKELGFLTKDEHGNIKFEKEVSAAKPVAPATPSIPATDSKPTIQLAEESTKPVAEKIAEKPAAPKAVEKKEVPKAKEEIKSTPKQEIKKTPKTEEKKPAVEIPPVTKKPSAGIPPRAIPSKPIEKKAIPSKPAAAASSNTNKGNTAKANPAKKTPPSNNNSGGSSKIVIIIAAIIIVGGGIWAGFHFEWFGKKEAPVAVQLPAPVIDTIVEVEPEPEPEPIVVEEPDHDPNAKKYYIVAGSFKVSANAENYNQKLIDDGYPSELVARNNGYHTVSYKTYYEWHEALAEWKNMREVNQETWILIR